MATALEEGMRKLAAGLRASLASSRLIEHALTKGEIREQDITDAFRPHFPKRYDLSSGIVVNGEGQQSRQQDLIVTDAHERAPFLTSGSIGVHPIENVVATVEIKKLSYT